jgi:hypothetical protein
MNNRVNLSLIVLGGLGMIVIAFVSIIDSHATDITSAIPVQLFFAAVFISGYVKYNDK